MNDTVENTALIAIEDIKVNEIFIRRRGLKALFKMIEDQTAGFVPDLETIKGRDEIAALAYRVARSKTALDKAGADLTADWREKTKAVNDVRKEIKVWCDELRDRIRQPLTDWEAERDRIKAEEEEKIRLEEQRLEDERLEELREREAEIERREAELKAREDALKVPDPEPEPETATEPDPEAPPERPHPRKNPVSNPKATEAFRALRDAIRLDPEYAHSWHCNLAVSFYDSMPEDTQQLDDSMTVANNGASRFMKLAFGVTTNQHPPT